MSYKKSCNKMPDLSGHKFGKMCIRDRQQPAPQPTYQQQPQNFPPPVDANGNVKDDLPFQRMLFDLKNDMEEIWKTVKGYNGYYQVSNTGKRCV